MAVAAMTLLRMKYKLPNMLASPGSSGAVTTLPKIMTSTFRDRSSLFAVAAA